MNTVVVTVLGLIAFCVEGVIMKVLLIVWMYVAAVIIQTRFRGKVLWTNGIFNTFE